MQTEVQKLKNKTQKVKMQNSRGPKAREDSKLAAIMLSPAILIMSLIILYPLFRSFILSFFNLELTKPGQESFVFLENFKNLLASESFWNTFTNTITFVLTTVAISVILGLIIAIAIDQLPKKYAGYRGVILVPWVIPGIVVGYLFMYMFDVEVGIINFFLQKVGIIESYLPWLMDGTLAMVAVIVAHIWNQIPFHILMITAGLKNVPHDTMEAAYVDGASRWQEFWHVTLPSLRGILVISSILMIIRNFNNFPIIFTMTGGGPGESTTTGVLHIYKLAFERYEISYASAMGIIWVLVLSILSIIYIRSLHKEI